MAYPSPTTLLLRLHKYRITSIGVSMPMSQYANALIKKRRMYYSCCNHS
jgi:hypothetical protein